MKYVTAEKMKQLDNLSINSGHSLLQMLELAGFQLASFVSHRYPARTHKNITVICGGGNNGAGGLCSAKHLINNNHNVKIFLASENLSEAAKHQYNSLLSLGANFNNNLDFTGENILVDGLIGYGLKGELDEKSKKIITSVNDSAAITVSLDIPSGLNPDTGIPQPIAVMAEHTIVLAAEKEGLKAKDYTGVLHTYDIGIPRKFYEELGIGYPF